MPIRFPNVNATFIHVPKTGGTSFYNWVYANVDSYLQPPENNYENGSVDGATKLWGDLGTIFSFVRNPYSRLVSMYTYHYAKAREYLKVRPKSLPMPLVDYIRVVAISEKGFDYWLDCVCNDREELYKIGDAAPDRMTVTSWFNGKIPNLIIKTEELNINFHHVRDLIAPGNTVQLPWDNVSVHGSYRDYYTDHSKQLVVKKFGEDLDNFKYTF